MEQVDWGARWRDGQIGFHQSRVSHALAKYGKDVWGEDPLGRVLVPLCGKSLDLVFLAERAEAVIGVEYVEQAVEEFFAERGRTPTVERAPHVRYHADNYTLFVADFFELTAGDLGNIDAVFDRASLVALDADSRPSYVDHMRMLLPSGVKTLLVSFHYDQAEMKGPPFSVPPEEIDHLYGEAFSVEQLAMSDVLDEAFRARGLTTMRETVFAITRR